MKEKRLLAEELFAAAEEIGLANALYYAFGKSVAVSLPFTKSATMAPIDDLEFSVRAINALKRAGAFTVGEVVDLIARDGLLSIKNLGRKTQLEIKLQLTNFAYSHLTKAEKIEFFKEVIARNYIK